MNNGQSKTGPSILVSGTIELSNSHGFLSTTQYIMLNFFFYLSIVYCLVGLIWVFNLRRFLNISIQHYVSCLLLLSTLECLFSFFDLWKLNLDGKTSIFLGMAVMLITSLRLAASRLVVLVLCLGYGIVMNTLEKYSQSIGILTFLLFVSSCCNYTVEVIN